MFENLTDKNGHPVEMKLDDSGHNILLFVDGQPAGEFEFWDKGDERLFPHTGVRPEFEGRGLGTLLITQGLEVAKNEGKTAVAICPMVKHYLGKHGEEYQAEGGKFRLGSGAEIMALWDELGVTE
ncbi:putative GNAT family acetyltransferase [Arcanobacterium wilhelmae]|uniref:GNAT family acetyltransferase n=1 Tax=Arcanobacterium wilhelmae TaxID=1803177 RepID=A0ABT9N9S3_9ACTO|nr:GNAT family N-acetyltransferase [Arcanobacterium wilhelmae]MDP9800441.1 putative GNAT family acetyltransferase [Arcanobacterium wilhelmae]WFN89861.1 GNAT family N-acetyltransferase [Arcanobacterium wilhelmae]